jgi:thiol-disulfide isomerase/thioredoxin
MKNNILYSTIIYFLISAVFIQYAAAENIITLDFYYSESCEPCEKYKPIINEIETNYTETLIVHRKEVGSNHTNWQEWNNYGFTEYPSVVINNEAKVPKNNITYENLENIINSRIEQLEQNRLNILSERLIATLILFTTTVIAIYLIAATYQKK